MTQKDYRIIVATAANLAKPCIWEGKKTYEVDLKQFIRALENIYPDLYLPVVTGDGKILNPKLESKED